MANVDAPFGLKPVRHLNGNPWNGSTQRCLIEDDYGTALFVGDPVTLTGAAGSDDTTGLPVIQIATAAHSNSVYGVIVSFEPDPDNLSRIYLPATTGGYAHVCIDPDVIFIIQDDGDEDLDGSDIGANALLNSTGDSGSTITGLSGWQLETGTVTADTTYQLVILQKHHVEDNAMGANCIWEVLISNHVLRRIAAATGQLGI